MNKAAYEGAKTLHYVDTSGYSNIDVTVHKINEKPVEVVKEKKVKIKKMTKESKDKASSRRDPNSKARVMIDARTVVMDRSSDWEISGSRGDFN